MHGTDPWNQKPDEGSVTAIHNWHGHNNWEHAVIKNGKAVKISEEAWHDLRVQGAAVNMPLYVTED
jgi:hypothetical protein